MIIQETAKMYKSDKVYNDASIMLFRAYRWSKKSDMVILLFSLPRFGLAEKVTMITMKCQKKSAHNADLNKSDNNYNAFVVFWTAKELARACKSL